MLPEEISRKQNQAAARRCRTIKHCVDSGSSRADVRGFDSRPPHQCISILALLHNKISAIGDWILFQCRVWDDIDAQEAIRLELEQRSQDRRLKTCIKSAAIFFLQFKSPLHESKNPRISQGVL